MFKLPVKFIYMRREAALTLLNTSFYLSLSSKLGPALIPWTFGRGQLISFAVKVPTSQNLKIP